METIVIIYLLLVNLVTFAVYGIDKWKARNYRHRVPEVTLLLLAAIGGSVGALLAMWLFRHKTLHAKFTWGVPGILAVQLLLCWLCSCGTARQQAQRTDVFQPIERPIGVPGVDYSPSTLIVMCDSTIGKQPLRKAIDHIGAKIIYDYDIICGMAISKPETMTLEATREALRKVKGVVSVEYDRITRLTDPVRPPVLER